MTLIKRNSTIGGIENLRRIEWFHWYSVRRVNIPFTNWVLIYGPATNHISRNLGFNCGGFYCRYFAIFNQG